MNGLESKAGNDTTRETLSPLGIRHFEDDLTRSPISLEECEKKFASKIALIEENDGILQKAKAKFPQEENETPIDYEIRVLSGLSDYFKTPTNFPQEEAIKRILDEKVGIGDSSQMLMALETVQARRMKLANEEMLKKQKEALEQNGRRDVKTEVAYGEDGKREATGDREHVFWTESDLATFVQKGILSEEQKEGMETEWKTLPKRDIFAFTLVADKFLDVKVSSMKKDTNAEKEEDFVPTYRMRMQRIGELLQRKNIKEERTIRLRKQLVTLRDDFYTHVIEAIETLDKPKEEKGGLDEKTRGMQAVLQSIRKDPDILEHLIKEYKGVGGDLSEKHKEEMRELLHSERLYLFDYALKGADLMKRRISYNDVADKLYAVPEQIYYKKFVQETQKRGAPEGFSSPKKEQIASPEEENFPENPPPAPLPISTDGAMDEVLDKLKTMGQQEKISE